MVHEVKRQADLGEMLQCCAMFCGVDVLFSRVANSKSYF